MRTQLFHNPRCSKSRQALALLQAAGTEPEIVDYLRDPPSVARLTDLVALLGGDPRLLLRASEPEFAELGLADAGLDAAALIAAMASHPRLLERPVFVHAGRAIIGRPPERVLELLDPPGA